MRIDEAYDRNGKKVRVKWVGFYDKKNHLEDEYYLFYDEAEVYHIESSTKKKIIYTFSCNSWYKASKFAIEFISFKNERGFERFKKHYNEEMQKKPNEIKHSLMKPEEFLLAYTKSEFAEMYLEYHELYMLSIQEKSKKNDE